MNKIRKITGLLAVLIALTSCSDFLNIKDESAVNSDIWNNEQTAYLYLNKIYNMCLPAFGGDNIYGTVKATACSDEVLTNPDMLIGTLASGQAGGFSADRYQAIRYINIAFDELAESANGLPQKAHDQICGQLYFFRAWQHWRIVLMHGGVPYMTKVVGYDTVDNIKNAPRNKTSECIAFMKQDLEKAIELLPATWNDDSKDYGRITRSTAAAVLGRILLYHASPQYTPDQTSQLARDRWQAAYEANKEAIRICAEDGFGLMDCATQPSKEWPTNADINKVFWDTGREKNKEALFLRVYNALDFTHSYEQSTRPGAQTAVNSASSNQPSLNLMKAFPNADGTPYTKSNTDMYYWKDRDSRFYSTIVYNGCYLPYRANNGYRQWTYNGGDPSNTPSSTGFYCRKMLNEKTVEFAKTNTNWIEMRYAEVLLNMAEAALEVGKTDEMYDCLGQLRKRAGIPEGEHHYGLKASAPLTNLELVMNERAIELAFEGKRFYDLRRRNMFTEDLGPNVKKLNGQVKAGWGLKFALKNASTAEEFKKNRDKYTMEEVTEYTKASKTASPPTANKIAYICYPDFESLSKVQSGSYNFLDVQEGILTRSPAIQQTMGWAYDEDRGVFNPFE